MANSKEIKATKGFNEMLSTARQKKKNEQLAEQIFGGTKRKNEKLAAQIFGRGRAPGSTESISRRGVSLSGRAGVVKPTQMPKRAPLAIGVAARSRPPVAPAGIRRTAAISKALDGSSKVVNVQTKVNSAASEISVKGMGGSYTIVAQNFAPGTTAADIEAVLAPDLELCLTACRLLSSHPTVIAELVFGSRDAAQAVVTKFNNKTADGRLLHVWLKDIPQNRTSHLRNYRSLASRPPEIIDVDSIADPIPTPPRPRRATPEYQDGRYGFDEGYHQLRSSYDQLRAERRGRGREGGLISDSILNATGRY